MNFFLKTTNNISKVCLIGLILIIVSVGTPLSAFAKPLQVAIVPFKVNAEKDLSFLKDGIVDMLSSRLFWEDKVSIINRQATEKASAALVKDLKQRGLLDETLVVWTGEFGRTPTGQNNKGRDHSPRGFSAWMAGGGVRGGQAIGATDDFGFAAVENKVHVHDLHATILHLLGLDHEMLTYFHGGREMRLTDVAGRIVKEVLA